MTLEAAERDFANSSESDMTANQSYRALNVAILSVTYGHVAHNGLAISSSRRVRALHGSILQTHQAG